MKLMLKNKNKKIKKSRGFALLFSVLIASLLLTIGLSIFSIALKELSISTASRQSVYAFYAADSGRECAFYWDIKRGEIPNLFDENNQDGQITCGQNSINITIQGIYSPNIYISQSNASVESTIPNTSVKEEADLNNRVGPNFEVTITKEITDRGQVTQALTSTIVSNGRDSAGGDRVERSIRQNY